jgi:hypothetical protein
MMETVPKARPYRIFGAAWCGNSTISKVEVSTDGGKQYETAKLLGNSIPHAWRLWEYIWNVPEKPGRHTLMARATDANGNSQPLERDRDREAYMINHVVPIDVQVS